MGYFQRLGVTAQDEEELIKLVREFLREDLEATLIHIDDFSVPDFEGADSDIRDRCGDTDKIGIWYSSGHAFYDEDEEEEDRD